MAAHLAPASRPSADKIKAFHALLLSLAVIAGAVTITTDAHAQTNTERLITVVDNTNQANDLLSSILDAVTSGFANVLEMLGVIDTDLEAIHGDLEDIHGDLSAVDTDLQEIHGDLEDIRGDLAALDGDMQTLSASISGLGAASAALGEVSQGVQTNAASINALNAKLDMISDAVGVVSNTTTSIQVAVETDSTTTTAAGPTNMLHSGETEQAVTVADFAGTVAKHPTNNVYKASNTFSCDGDVFLDTMKVADPNDVIAGVLLRDTDSDRVLPMTTVTVNGFNLYKHFDTSADDTPIAVGTDDVANIGEDRDFDNQFLAAGNTLVIKGSTDQSVDTTDTTAAGTTIDATTAPQRNYLSYGVTNDTATAAESDTPAGTVYFTIEDYVAMKSRDTRESDFTQDGASFATKNQLGEVELYTVTVTWFAPSSDTTCSISSATSTSPGLDNTGTVLLGLSVNATGANEDAVRKPIITETVDCGGENTEITDISIAAGALAGLGQYNTIELNAGDSSSTVRFASDGTVDADKSKLPFKFSGADLMVNGTALNDLLIQISYATVKDNTCES